MPGIVVEVPVTVGQKVKAGDPLFRLDDRELKAELEVRKAMFADAKVAFARLTAMPRPEELPQAEAAVREAKADWENWEQLLGSRREAPHRPCHLRRGVHRAKAVGRAGPRAVQPAVAEYNLLKAGSWELDRQVAQSAIDRAESQVNQTQTELDRLVVRALVDGEVLQVNVRPGEFVGPRLTSRSSCWVMCSSCTCTSISTSMTFRGLFPRHKPVRR